MNTICIDATETHAARIKSAWPISSMGSLWTCNFIAPHEPGCSNKPPDLILVDITWDVRGASDKLARHRQNHPAVPIVILFALESVLVKFVIASMRNGIANDAILADSENFAETLSVVLERFRRKNVADRIVSASPSSLPSRLKTLLRTIASRTHTRVSVESLASEVSADRRTVNKMFRSNGMLPPSKIIGFNRCLHAVHRLNYDTRPIAQIAEDLRFSSSSDLSHMLKRYFGRSAGGFRENGSFEVALQDYKRYLDPHPASLE